MNQSKEIFKMMSRWNYIDMLPLKCEFCKRNFLQHNSSISYSDFLIACPYCNRYVHMKWHRFVAGRKWKATMKL